MSQNWQPPQQPQQPGGYGYPQQPQPGGYPQQPGGYPQQPGGYPQQPGPQYGGGFPQPVPPARQGNAVKAALLAFAVAVIGAIAYAFLLSALADTDISASNPSPSVTHIAYAFVILGALVGATIGRFGGRNPGLWVLGAVFALIAAFFGELYGYAMIIHDTMSSAADAAGGAQIPGGVLSTSDIFFDNFGDLWDAWKEDADAVSYIFIALAPVSAASVAYRASNSH